MIKNIKIKNFEISNKSRPYIVAELSANHSGELKNVYKAIKVAKKSGADAIKIQTYTPDTMTIDSSKNDFKIKKGLWKGDTLYELYKKAYTPFEWHDKIFKYADKIGITCFSTPFDKTAVDLLESLNTPIYKIASFEITDLELLEYIASKKKPIILSTGMANLNEIKEAIKTINSKKNNNIILLHCVSGYPSPISEINLKTIRDLREKFNLHVGLSDHTLTNIASTVSVAYGSCLIEKHFKLNNKLKTPDDKFSLLPNQLSNLCEDTKSAWLSLGKANYQLKKSEKPNIIFRRSLYFVNDLKKNTKISRNDVRIIRPGYGLEPKYIKKILGKKLNKNVSKGTRVSLKLFK